MARKSKGLSVDDALKRIRARGAERQARHRAKQAAQGVVTRKLTPEDLKALDVGRAALAGRQTPQDQERSAAIQKYEQALIAIGNRVVEMGGWKRWLVEKLLGPT